MIKKSIYLVVFVFGGLSTSCEKWRIDKYDERIVGDWKNYHGVSFGGGYNFTDSYTDDGIFTVYKESCSKEKVYEGPYSYKINGTSLFIIKSSTQADTFQIKKLTKSQLILVYIKNGSPSVEMEYLKCD